MKSPDRHKRLGSVKKHVLTLGWIALICVNSVQAHVDVIPKDAKALLDTDDSLTVIDVREPYEYCGARGHIPGALNYPWSSGVLRSRFAELDKTHTYLVVCQSGGRSNAAASFLDSQGFVTLYDMMGGMGSWLWETTGCIDSDGDGVNDDLDNAPTIYNPDQAVFDSDGDGVGDELDNAPFVYNPDQADADGDGVGNVVDTDYPRLYVADRVDFYDFAVMALKWQEVGGQLPADLDHDGLVGLGDLLALVKHWLQ